MAPSRHPRTSPTHLPMKPLVLLCCLLWISVPAGAQNTSLPPAPPTPAPAVPTVPCLFLPPDLTPVLARTPTLGVAHQEARGNICIYTMPTKELRQLIVSVDERFTAERFEQRVKLAARVAASKPVMLADIGDGAFYVAGVAGARRGLKYVEISGLRQAAARPIKPEDAATLLRLALERLPRY